MKPLGWMIAIALGGAACGGKKTEPTASPPSPPASGSAAPANPTCEAEGGKCISQATATTCGTKSHDGGCPDPSAAYCCIP
jgi:hypothetical protein